jgi:hypothetical protein
MKLVYIAGPYMGTDYHQTEQYITYAREWADKLARAGHAFYAPQLNTAHFDAVAPDVPKYFWQEMNLAILHRCDALLLVPGWDNDEETKRDMHYAETWGIPIVVDIDEIGGLSGPKDEKTGS